MHSSGGLNCYLSLISGAAGVRTELLPDSDDLQYGRKTIKLHTLAMIYHPCIGAFVSSAKMMQGRAVLVSDSRATILETHARQRNEASYSKVGM